jgi:hypothetical protein
MDIKRRDSKTGLNLKTLILGSFLALFSTLAFGQVSQIPREAANYLNVTGSADNGDHDTVMVLFYEVPDTAAGMIYFGINDPSSNDPGPDTLGIPDLGTGTTNYYLYGGSGALSHPNSQLVDYPIVPSALGTPGGTVLDSIIGVTSDTWEYFAGVDVTQGEKIGNKYYFKIVAEAQTALVKDDFQVDISVVGTNGLNPTGLAGTRAFAFMWSIAPINAGTHTLYPFVPESAPGPIQIYTWDADSADTTTGPELYDNSGVLRDANIATSNNSTGTFTYATGADQDVDDPPLNNISVDNTAIPGGEDNGTWRLVITADANGPTENTMEVWAGEGEGATLYRIYSDAYTPAAADHVTIANEDGVAKSDDADTETFTLQIVDAAGNPVPYVRDVDVTATGAGTIRINGGAATATIQTDANGLASFTLQADTAGNVDLSLVTDGSGGSSNLPNTVANGTSFVLFQALLPVDISSQANATLEVSTADQAWPNIVITDPDGRITAGNDIRIRIPTTLSDSTWGTTGGITFDTSGMAAPPVTLTPSGAGTDTLLIDTSDNFTAGDVLVIQNPLISTGTDQGSVNLEISIDNDVTYPFTDDKILTVADSTTKQWIGAVSSSWNTAGNWSPAGVPGPGDDVVINSVANDPTLDIDITLGNELGNLTIVNGATLDAAGRELRFLDLFNDGNLEISTGTTLAYTTWDVDSGTVTWTGTGGGIQDFGAIDYYNLTINSPGQNFTMSSNVTIAGTLSIVADSLNTGNNDLNITGDLTGAGAITTGGNPVVIGGDVTIDTLNTGASTITVGGAFNPTTFNPDPATLLVISGDQVLPAGPYADLTITGGNIVLGADLVVNGDFEISGGSLDVTATPYNITVGGNWTNSGGTFEERTGLVTLTGDNISVQTQAGDEFFDLTISNAAANIALNSDITVNGTTRARGAITGVGLGDWDFGNLILFNDLTITSGNKNVVIGTVISNLADNYVLTLNTGDGTQTLGEFGPNPDPRPSGAVLTLNQPISLPSMNLAGDLTVNALAISQSGRLAIGGASSFTAGANTVTLTNAGNDFGGAISTNNTGANVDIVDSTATVLGTITMNGGTLDVTSGGAISDTGVLNLTGAAASFTSTAADQTIDLDSPGSTFGGNLSFDTTGNAAVNVVVTASDIALATLSLEGTTGLSVDTDGIITDAVGALNVPGVMNLDATTGNIIIDDDGAYGSLTLYGATVLVEESDDMVVNSATGTTALTLTTTTATASIQQDGDVAVDATSPVLTLNAQGSIDLDTAAGSIDASITVRAGNILLDEIDGVTLNPLDTVNGSITVTAGGAIAATDVQATDGAVQLTSSVGDITATLVYTNDGDIQITAAAALDAVDIESADGAVTLVASNGNVDARRVISRDPGPVEAFNLTITASDSILLDSSTGGLLADNDLILSASIGAITDATTGPANNFTATGIQFTAASGIGTITNFSSASGDPIEGTFDNLVLLRTTDDNSGIYVVDLTGDVLLSAGALDPSTGLGLSGGQAILESSLGTINASANGSISALNDENIQLIAAVDIVLPTAPDNLSTGGDYIFAAADIRTTTAWNNFGTISADNLVLVSNGSDAITMPVNAATLRANFTNALLPSVTFNETNDIDVLDLDTAGADFTITSGGDITLTDVDTLAGTITVNAGADVVLTDVDTNNADIIVNAADAVTLTAVDTRGGNLQVNSTTAGNILLQAVNLGAGNARVDNTIGAITGDGGGDDLIANNASFGAPGNITGLEINVANLAAASSGGLISILDTAGGVTVDTVDTIDGLSTGGGAITLNSNAGITLADLGIPITVRSNNGAIILDADADGPNSGDLTMLVGSEIDSGTGTINLNSYNDLRVTEVTSANGTDAAITATSNNTGGIVPVGAGPHFTLSDPAGRLVLDSNDGVAHASSLSVAVTELSVLNDAREVNIAATTANLQIHGFTNNGAGANTISSGTDIRIHSDINTNGGTVDFNNLVQLTTGTFGMSTAGGNLDFNAQVSGVAGGTINMDTAGGDINFAAQVNGLGSNFGIDTGAGVVNLGSGTFGNTGFGGLTVDGAAINLFNGAATDITANNGVITINAPINMADGRDLNVTSTGAGQNITLGTVNEAGAAAENLSILTAGGDVTLGAVSLTDNGSILQIENNAAVILNGAVDVEEAIRFYTQNDTTVMTVGGAGVWEISDASLANITGVDGAGTDIIFGQGSQSGNIILDSALITAIQQAAITLNTSGQIRLTGVSRSTGSSYFFNGNTVITGAAEIDTTNASAPADVTFNGTITGNQNLVVSASTANFNQAVTLLGTASFEITNTALLTATHDWIVNGEFNQLGGGAVNWTGNLTTLNEDIEFSGPLDLQDTVTFSTNGGGGNVTLGNDLLGANTFDFSIASGTGHVVFGGAIGDNGAGDLRDLTVSGAYAEFTGTDLYLDGSFDFTGTGYTRVNISANAQWNLAGTSDFNFSNFILEFPSANTLSFVDDNVTATNLAFFRGTWDPSGASFTLSGDLVMTGDEYLTEDDPDFPGGNGLIAYPDYGDLGGYPLPGYNAVFTPGGLDGTTWNVGDDFFVHSMDLTAGAAWDLNLQDNTNDEPAFGSPFSGDNFYNVAFETTVSFSRVSGGVIAAPSYYDIGPTFAGNVDAGNNTAVGPAPGWVFDDLTILSAETLSDDMIRVTFNRQVENSQNEIRLAVEAGRIRYNNGAIDFDRVYLDNGNLNVLNNTGDSTDLAPGNKDLTVFVLSNSDTAETWNTDAFDEDPGDIVGVRSTDEQGNPRNILVNLEIAKYSLFDSESKASMVDYTITRNNRFISVADGAHPVLYAVEADRYGAEPDGRSDHNFFRLRYSEPVNIDTEDADLQLGGGGSNFRVADSHDNNLLGEIGGDIEDSLGTVTVEGFFEYDGNFDGGSWDATPTFNAIRKENTHDLHIIIAGARVGANWIGYIASATDPLVPINANINAIYDNDGEITDAAGNVLNTALGASTVTPGGTPWDVDPPAFAPYLGDGFIREAITLDSAPENGRVDRIEFHILDNGSSAGAWDSETGHNDGLGGVRDNSLDLAGFEFSITGANSFTSAFTTGFLTGVTSELYLGVLPNDNDPNDPYFTITTDNLTTPWSAVDQLDFTYTAATGRMTDLAGNLLPSTSITYPRTIERTPPRVALSLSALDSNKLYLRFSETVYPITPIPDFEPDDFNIGAFENATTVLSVDTYGLPATNGVTEMVLTLDAEVTDQDFFTGSFNIVGDSIRDFFDNRMLASEIYPASALGINLVTPLWASDGFGGQANQSGTARVINSFDGDDFLFDQDIDLQIRINSTDAGILALPVALFYDANENPATLFDGDNWLPFAVPGIDNTPNTNSRLILPYNTSGPLLNFHNFIIPSSDPDMSFGKRIDFLPRVGTLLNVYSNNPNDPSDFSLYSFGIRDLTRQKGGVTVLNNIINPTLGEQAQVIYTMEDSGIATVQIFALDGSIVRVLHRERQAAGEYRQFWDGRNEAGDIVARGMYFVRVVAPGVDEMRNILLVK